MCVYVYLYGSECVCLLKKYANKKFLSLFVEI